VLAAIAAASIFEFERFGSGTSTPATSKSTQQTSKWKLIARKEGMRE
jgi:hypothetical protein